MEVFLHNKHTCAVHTCTSVVLAQFGAELLSVSASEHGTKAVRLNMEPMAVRLNMEPMAVRLNMEPMAVRLNMEPMAVRLNMEPMAVRHNMELMAVRLNMEPMAVRPNMEPMAVREGCVLFTKRMLSNERREEMAMLIPCVNLRGSAAFFLGGSAVDAVLEQQ